MPDITFPTSDVPSPEQPPLAEESVEMTGQTPTLDDVAPEEEIGEELIIEDFTIDGICGVY